MSTIELPILGWATKPDTSGSVWAEPYSVQATNDFWDGMVWVFDDTSTDIVLHGRFTVPRNLVSTPVLVLSWTTTATSGNVVWGFAYRNVGGSDTTSLDQATAVETVSVTSAAPTAANRQMLPTVALTLVNFTAGQRIQFRISRNGTSGSDTMAAKALLFEALLSYADV